MSRINSRSKGIRGERDVIDKLQPVVNEVYAAFNKQAAPLQRNTLQYDDGGSDIAGLDFLALEVKNCATLQLKQWWEQTVAQAEKANKHQTPVLIYKAGRGTLRVRMWGQVLTTLSDPTTCVVDIDWDAFLSWFKTELFGYLSGDNQTKKAPAVAPVAISRPPISDLPMREQFKLAGEWCKKSGYEVPARKSPEFARMFDYWLNLAINGEV